MKPEKVAGLVRITRLKFQIEYEAVKVVLREEARIRADLCRLDAQIASAGRSDDSDCTMETIGAGVLWQAWVARTRRNLNVELAGILARKPHAMERVRQAFGRHQATQELWRKAESKHKMRKTR